MSAMPLRRSKRFAAAASVPDAAAAAAPQLSLDMLPDDLVLKLEPHLNDVLLPRHLGRFASTSKAMRRLLADQLAALKDGGVDARAVLGKCGKTVDNIVRIRLNGLSFYSKDLVAADAPALGRVLCSEATAQLSHLSLKHNHQLGAATAITTAVAGGGLKRLHSLHLTCTKMGAEGMQRLSACLGDGGLPRLSHLYLGSNGIGDEGVAFLAEALATKKAPALTFLDLDINEIGDEGIKALMATAAKGKLATLQILDLQGNPFGEAGAEILADTITSCMAGGLLPALGELTVPYAHKGNVKLLATGLLKQQLLDMSLGHAPWMDGPMVAL